MRKFRYTVAFIGLVLLLNACQNPYGTDPDVIKEPVPVKRGLLPIDANDVQVTANESIGLSDDKKTFCWDNYYKLETQKYTIDTNISPPKFNIETKVNQNFPEDYIEGRRFIIESYSIKINDIPFRPGCLYFGEQLSSAEIYVLIKESKSGRIFKKWLDPSEYYLWVKSTMPCISYSLRLITKTDFFDDLDCIYVSHKFCPKWNDMPDFFNKDILNFNILSDEN